ncbi:phosphoglucosamine mutase [Aminithiophilus ramosus]|uniref:Phosphoglucosamine mutase n=2 Tax=Synergistales TaxID=649776 RepID=A0A9Q7AAR0_9BACT|nr:phosphoglucosamine mutase [Aminithiophilus ramosus]QVL35090.1 phosphoglucosamine mutase [Synergistota bacterium]
MSKAVRCLFGTDGVRDVANRGTMTPEMALRLGRAFVFCLTEAGSPRPSVVVGRDTRRSGPMLEAALVAGLTSAGAEVTLVDVLPTPGVSFAVGKIGAAGGAVISASHNPAEYNGIKFLDGQGGKLSDAQELAIEETLGDALLDDWRPTGGSVGSVVRDGAVADAYLDRLAEFSGIVKEAFVVDCAHGAASALVPRLFERLGSSAHLIGASPDGLNINEGVGVMHMESLSTAVRTRRAPFGIAYDGDADRVLFCDGQGRLLDGDIMLWVLARWMARRGDLGRGVVATVMSNMALEERLGEAGIPLVRCPVGDRYVLEAMRENTMGLGGEQSGHVILGPWVGTGDGLLTGLAFLRACRELNEEIDSLVDRFGRYPQLLRNIAVSDKKNVLQSVALREALASAEARLGEWGRIFVRASGTEPLVRVLVEAKDALLMEELVEEVSSAISEWRPSKE